MPRSLPVWGSPPFCGPTLWAYVLAQALDQPGVGFAFHLYRHGPHGLSTADALGYPANAVPAVSWDVPGWPEAMAHFFTERGLTVPATYSTSSSSPRRRPADGAPPRT